MKKVKNISTPKLIFGCALIFAIGCFLALWITFHLLTETSLEQLPNVPEPPTATLGMELSDWYDADPIVQTASRNVYQYRYELDAGAKEWQLINQANPMPDETCESRDEAKIEISAGNIIDCRSIQLTGEWCPPPNNQYVLTE